MNHIARALEVLRREKAAHVVDGGWLLRPPPPREEATEANAMRSRLFPTWY